MSGLPHRPTPGYLIWRLSMKWRASVDAAVAPLGLTHAQYTVLASLRGITQSGQSPSQRQLADYTGLDPIYISKLVRRLESAGLIERAPDPDDSRAVTLTITVQGARVVDHAIGIVRQLQEDLTAPLGGTSSRRMQALMNDLELLITAPSPTTRSQTNDKKGSTT
jgi:DNA-binding MarR family transcriptional regulator